MIKDRESELTLWVAVIEQALNDATLGLALQIRALKNKPTSKRRISQVSVGPGAGYSLHPDEVTSARRFIKGLDGSLRDICEYNGLDYGFTREILLKVYRECQPYMTMKWQDKEFL